MAKADKKSCIDQIGETAGKVWHLLNKSGPLSVTKIGDEIGGARDVALAAIGWLAREGKIAIEEKGRSKSVSLVEAE